MTKPTFYPEWATLDTTLPAAGTGNKERPQEILRTVGFDKGQVATAQEFNWLFDNVYDWIVHLDTTNTTNKTFTLAGDVTGSATYNNEAGWSVTTTVVDNSHNHVSANISDASYSNFPNTIVKRDASGNFTANLIYANLFVNASTSTLATNATNANHAVSADLATNANNSYACSGNSATASKWATARTFSLSGKATGSASVDGSGDISLNVTSLDTSLYTNMTSIYTGSGRTASASINTYTGREIIVCLVDGNSVCFGNIPVSFVTSVKTSGEIYTDYGNSGDFILTYTYTSPTLSLTSSRGNIAVIYVR